MSEDESGISAEEYLEFLRDHAGAGFEDVTARDIGLGVLAPDFASQLVAVRSVLARNHEAEDKAAAEIKNREARIRRRAYGPWMEDERVDHLHGAAFLDAAHSMAAVGLIAPLVESLFERAFRYLKGVMGQSYSLQSDHERWQLDDRWDHHLFWKRGRGREDIAKGIVQLAEAIDLTRHLPGDLERTLERTLSALFAYRNKMFHCGLEWPERDLAAFASRISQEGWAQWFTVATSGRKPWIFYMSREFTEHCLETVDGIIEGIGARVLLEWER